MNLAAKLNVDLKLMINVKINGKEVTVKEPTIVKETVIKKEEYDASPLMAEIGYLNDKVDKIKIPEPYDDTKLKEELSNEFAKNFKKNIDTIIRRRTIS